MGKSGPAAEKSVRYVGRYEAVQVRTPDGESYATVERGEVLVTSAEQAEGLLLQQGEWLPASAKYDPARAPAPVGNAATKEGEG